jgi:hypothetical protein
LADLSKYKEVKTWRVEDPDIYDQLAKLNKLLADGWDILDAKVCQFASPVKEEGRVVGFSSVPAHCFTLGRAPQK